MKPQTERKYDIFWILNLGNSNTQSITKITTMLNPQACTATNPQSYIQWWRRDNSILDWISATEWQLARNKIVYGMINWKLKYMRLYFHICVSEEVFWFRLFSGNDWNNFLKIDCFCPYFSNIYQECNDFTLFNIIKVIIKN